MATLAQYATLLRQFMEGRIDPNGFYERFEPMYRTQTKRLPTEVFDVLESIWGVLMVYEDGDKGDSDDWRADEQDLRRAVSAALPPLERHLEH